MRPPSLARMRRHAALPAGMPAGLPVRHIECWELRQVFTKDDMRGDRPPWVSWFPRVEAAFPRLLAGASGSVGIEGETPDGRVIVYMRWRPVAPGR